MKIATDRSPIRFADAPDGPCACAACTAPPVDPGGRIHRLVRRTCIATTVLAGAGVLGLTVGATTANAMPAPSKQGWDGARYWFKNTSGEWRWTSHQSVYLNRSTAPSGGGGQQQGWDGSRYWFRNSSGEWRWTSHYDVYLDRTGRSGSRPTPVTPPPPASGSNAEAAIGYALAQLGKPYVWGGNGPSGYDCSGLVQQAYRRSGISLPRVADDQYRATTAITAGELRRGDLVFWSGNGRASGIHHVGIYLGDNRYVEAPRPGKTVRISTLSAGYYPTHFGRA
ncbi:C40 family peptidase [Kitasatospora sp. NPDC002227]|uniref:C40 family peptidase n=1 Tax=Kitasatospora sp. NPDC002227 TaxID=3154773 RepID=UPI00332F95BE